ncbi:MAG: hypothetical protein IJZ46_04745 [Bacilli bacterium]|nr:hypothetical protein [Bacilli bacterium]
MSSLRNDNLNAFKDYINGYKNDVSYLCKILNNCLSSSFYVEDIIEVYKGKIFDYSDELNDKEIDFFSPDCFTRYIIKIYFDILIIHGISDLSWLMNNANKIRFVSNYLPFLSNITFGKVIERYNKICEDIRNFHFSNNKDVIINFFSNKLLFDGFLPGSVIMFWQSVKSELDVLDVVFTQDELDMINEQVLNREFEAVQRYHELGESAFSVFETKCSELGLNLQYDQDLSCACQMKKTLN